MMPYAEWMTGVAIALERINQRLSSTGAGQMPPIAVTQRHYALYGELTPAIAAPMLVGMAALGGLQASIGRF